MSEVIKAYKGFDKSLQCRGFQFEVGKEFEEPAADVCKKGFHACEMPLEVLKYYEPGNGSRYCVVEQSGEISREASSTKVASSKIKIGAEIGIPGLVKAQFEYVQERATTIGKHHTTGDRSANSATGDRSANSATGDWSANSATGYRSANSATGSRSANSATGYRSANSATGDRSANSATGYGSANSATGYRSANSATGYGSANVSTGTGCKNDAAGERNIGVAWGPNSFCKGSVGSYLVLSEWGAWDGEKYPFIGASMLVVDGENIKPDTWYTMKNGNAVEVSDPDKEV